MHTQMTLIHRPDGHLAVQCAAGTIHFTGLLDTGASEVIVSRKVADLLGLDLSKAESRVWLKTFTGETSSPAFLLPELCVGQLKVSNARVLVDDRAAGEAYDAIIGVSVFRGLQVGLTLENRE